MGRTLARRFSELLTQGRLGRPRQWHSAVLMKTTCANQINPGCAEDSCDDDVHVAVIRREGQRWGSLRSSAGEARRRRVGDLLRIRGKHRGRSGQRRRRQARTRAPDRMTRAISTRREARSASGPTRRRSAGQPSPAYDPHQQEAQASGNGSARELPLTHTRVCNGAVRGCTAHLLRSRRGCCSQADWRLHLEQT